MKITGSTPTIPLDLEASAPTSTASKKPSSFSTKELTSANIETNSGSVFLQALQSTGTKTLEQRSAENIPTNSAESILSQLKTGAKTEDIWETLTQNPQVLAEFQRLAQEENLQPRHILLATLV